MPRCNVERVPKLMKIREKRMARAHATVFRFFAQQLEALIVQLDERFERFRSQPRWSGPRPMRVMFCLFIVRFQHDTPPVFARRIVFGTRLHGTAEFAIFISNYTPAIFPGVHSLAASPIITMQSENHMRVSDDRYSRDRLRLDLALRFIRHEARTHTIRAWTGLTDDRIRKLYRSYINERPGDAVARHRGKSPQQAGFFTRSSRIRQETALLASLCCLLGVMPVKALGDVSRTLPGVLRGELLCQAFEAYRSLIPDPQITFEHAVFLVSSLMRGDELKLTGCIECGSLLVVDRLMLRDPRCLFCMRPDSDCMTPAQRAARAQA
jgi:hypothetical protein